MNSLLSLNDRVKLIAEYTHVNMGDDPVHGWPHVERVARYCEIILEKSNADVNDEVLALAVILHDIGRSYKSETHHAVIGSKIARMLLKGMGYEDDVIDHVVHAILAHSYSLGIKARTMEAKILSDADKLDALGAIGIFRVIYESGKQGRGFNDTLKHLRDKILRLLDHLYLKESKSLALELHRRVELYASWLSDELDFLGLR